MRRVALLALTLVPLACTFGGLDAYTSGDGSAGVDGGSDATLEDSGPDVVAVGDASDAGDTSTAADVVTDAPVAPCNLSAPFGAPKPVTSLNTSAYYEAQAALSPDERTVYFLSSRLGQGMNVFTASRANKSLPFGSAAAVPSLNFAGTDTWNVTLTGDGLTAYFLKGADMYKATRASSLAAFGSAIPMPSPLVDGEHPFVLPNGSTLYYSYLNKSAEGVIMRTPLGGAPAPVMQSSLAVSGHNVGIPVVDPTETTIYFAVYDTTTYDIWMATRKVPTGPWSAPVAVTELNTTAFQTPSWLSADACELYFTRVPGPTNWDIYVARRP